MFDCFLSPVMMYPKKKPLSRRHLMLALPVLVVFSLFIAGCSPQPAGPEAYTHPELGYSVQIPASWEGKYRVAESVTGQDGVRIASFDYTAAGEPYNFLFRIAAYPDDVWTVMTASGEIVLNTEQLAHDDAYVYTLIRTLDNPYDGEFQTEYGLMAQDINGIADGFLLKGQEASGSGETVVYFGNSQRNADANCALVYPVTRDLTGAPDVPYAALRALFAGPTQQEQAEGYTSFFSSETADLVRSMTVQGGTAYVNLADFRTLIPNASSSCGSANLLSEITSTLTQFPRINRVIIAIDGDTQTFYDWIQIGCGDDNDNCNNEPFRSGQTR